MPRLSWRGRTTRRRLPDPDRPGPGNRGRWAGRLRRGGVFARQMLRIRPRRGDGFVREAAASHPGRATRLAGRATSSVAAESRAVHASGVAIRPQSSTHPQSATRPQSAGPTGLAGPGVVGGAADPSANGAELGGEAEPAEPPPLLPGEPTASRRLGFVVANSCTLLNLSLGLLAILLATAGEARLGALALLACVVCDGLDGALARRFGVSSPFGAQLDSLADMCAFGAAAPVVVYASVVDQVPVRAAALACVLATGCAAIRLARFNVSPRDGRFFTGVPTTMAAGVLASAVLLDLPLPPVGLLVGVVLLAFAMVSSFPYPTLARLLRLPPWLWLAPLAGLLVDLRLTFLVVVVAYLASGPVLWVHRRRTAGTTRAAGDAYRVGPRLGGVR